MIYIYIDKETGTWGSIETLAAFTVTQEDIDYLNECSDSEIRDFAEANEALEWYKLS